MDGELNNRSENPLSTSGISAKKEFNKSSKEAFNNFSRIVYEFLNNHKQYYLITGIVFFSTGIVIDAFYETKEHCIWIIALSHFLVIFGEALFVFFLVNVVMENEEKEKTRKLIEEKEKEIIASFDKVSVEVLKKTSHLVEVINNDLFRMVLQERTSAEIAQEICQKKGFFEADFLKTPIKMEYLFSFDKESNTIKLLQTEEVIIKNISKKGIKYLAPLSLTSTSSKTYSFKDAGYTHSLQSDSYSAWKEDHFNVKPIKGQTGNFYELKEGLDLAPDGQLKMYRNFETRFDINKDGIDDFFFALQYIMPYTLIVKVPDEFEFRLDPTFAQERLGGPNMVGLEFRYGIPFLLPGQGFNFSVNKKEVKP